MDDIEVRKSMDKLEMLARAWIECDPNRAGAERFSGFHPDDTNDPRDLPPEIAENIGLAQRRPSSKGEPHWKWFLPRAARPWTNMFKSTGSRLCPRPRQTHNLYPKEER